MSFTDSGLTIGVIYMSVFRVERTENYTVMSNYHLRDLNLSLKAKGLLSMMLSLPENWDYTLSGLSCICKEGKDSIRAGILELEKAGYIQRSQTIGKDGKFGSNDYVIREAPVGQEPPLEEPSSGTPLSEEPSSKNQTAEKPTAGASSSAQPLSENPTTDSTSTEKPTERNKDIRSKDKQKKDLPGIDSIPSPLPPSAPPISAAAPREPKRRERSRGRQVMTQGEMDACREIIRENIGYSGLVLECPYDVGQLDEMVELMVEAVCSKRETIRVSGNDYPQAVVKGRLLKLNRAHIRFVFDCLRANTTQVRNVKQYLLAVLFNAPVTMENHYAAQVNHDLNNGAMTA